MFVATAPPHHMKDMRVPFKLWVICTVYMMQEPMAYNVW